MNTRSATHFYLGASHSQAVRVPKLLLCFCLVMAINLFSPQYACAQSINPDILHDIQQARRDAGETTELAPSWIRQDWIKAQEGAGQGEPNYSFTFQFELPVFYNTNAEGARSDGSQAFETNPDLRLKLTKDLPKSWEFSGVLDANSDRFAGVSSANSDSSYLLLKLQHTDPADDQAFEPYFSYKPTLSFESTFDSKSTTIQDFELGFNKATNFDVNRKHIGSPNPVAHSERATVWSFGFTGSIKRRLIESDPSILIITADPSLTYNITNAQPDPDGAPDRRGWRVHDLELGCDVLDPLGLVHRIQRVHGAGLALAPGAVAGVHDQRPAVQAVADVSTGASTFHAHTASLARCLSASPPPCSRTGSRRPCASGSPRCLR